jgi:peptidoglycan/LPS O-acetylase OafA/YrhL
VSGGAVAPPATRSGTRFPCFDGLRAIAASLIVVFHVASTTGSTTQPRYGPYLARLDVGVPVFFVVSGFLLYRPFVVAHLGGRPALSWRDFWWRRAWRIYPAYWVALTAAILLFRSTHLHGVADYARHYALVQIYWRNYGLSGLVPAWTLAVEVSFYAALPLYAGLLARATARGDRSRALLAELGGVALLYAGGLGVRAWLFFTIRPGTVSAQWLPAQLDLFALGIGLAVLSAAATEGLSTTPSELAARPLRWLGDHPGASWALSALAFLAVCNIGLTTTFGVNRYQRKEEMAHQILYGLSAFFLVVPAVFGPQDAGVVRRVLRSRVATSVGIVSYGVFLWHYDWMNQLVDFGLLRHVHSFKFPVLFTVVVVLTLATAMLSWFVVERPALSYKYRPPRRRAGAGR